MELQIRRTAYFRAYAGSVLADSYDVVADVEALRHSHGVSGEIIAWQAHNSDYLLDQDASRYLQTLISPSR